MLATSGKLICLRFWKPWNFWKVGLQESETSGFGSLRFLEALEFLKGGLTENFCTWLQENGTNNFGDLKDEEIGPQMLL